MEKYLNDSLFKLEKSVRINDYMGYDPYDALNSKILDNIHNRWLRVFFTQLFVYNPINLRNFFNIKNDINPKAIGLFLSAYCKLYKNGLIDKKFFEKISLKLVELLLKYKSKGYSGDCWGFNFNWQDINRNAKRWLPTIVVTSYVGNSILDLFEIKKEQKYLDIAKSICKFILEDLFITETENGICFSYTPIDKSVVHNANCLGAAYLSRVYSITQRDKLLDYSRKAFNFTVSCQKKDGSWAYSINPNTHKVRNQIDFHQGFILDSLIDFLKHVGENNKKYNQSLKKGTEFYLYQQFKKDGMSKWRLPLNYPVDIHHQAQGIITFIKCYIYSNQDMYLDFAKRISKWTIKNMQDKKGYFYYQKLPFFTNKILYMRWGQAWMLLALTSLLEGMSKYHGNKKN